MVNTNNVAATQKPCQFCGTLVSAAAAIVGCSPCQRYNLLEWHKAHPQTVQDKRKAA